MRRLFLCFIAAVASVVGGCCQTYDWPQWRYDHTRSNCTDQKLSDELHLLWQRDFPPPQRAWTDIQNESIYFDESYTPIVMGKHIIVGSMNEDCVIAYDTNTGMEKWRFLTGGPVRLAPVGFDGKVAFVSDDGYCYCVNAVNGRGVWERLLAPKDYKIIANKRICSMWPARGAPVYEDGRLYMAAGVFNFTGIFYYCLEAETGEVVWCNSDIGQQWARQPHGPYSFSTISPQGYTAINGDIIAFSGGRSAPAFFLKSDGRLLHCSPEQNGTRKMAGDYCLQAGGKYFMSREVVYFADGAEASHFPYFQRGCMDGDILWHLEDLKQHKVETMDLSQNPEDVKGRTVLELTKFDDDNARHRWYTYEEMSFLKASDKLFFSGSDGMLLGYNIVHGKDGTPKLNRFWTYTDHIEDTFEDFFARQNKKVETQIEKVEEKYAEKIKGKSKQYIEKALKERDDEISGITQSLGAIRPEPFRSRDRPFSMIAADRKLFVMTRSGKLLCFSARETEIPARFTTGYDKSLLEAPVNPDIEKMTGDFEFPVGYAMVIGIGDGQLPVQLYNQTRLNIVVVDADREKADEFKVRMCQAGIYGERMQVICCDPFKFPMSQYFAKLIICNEPSSQGFDVVRHKPEDMYRLLRPYGGKLLVKKGAIAEDWFTKADLSKAQVSQDSNWLTVERVGKLEGAGYWTHNYCDSYQSSISKDTIAKAPFGLLWFGGATNDEILPRHQHGPTPMVINGRIIVPGVSLVRCMDAYTGLVIWEYRHGGIGRQYNTMFDIPVPFAPHGWGATGYGSNLVAVEDGVYLNTVGTMRKLDLDTGKVLAEWRIEGDGKQFKIGTHLVYKDKIIITVMPYEVVPDRKEKEEEVTEPVLENVDYAINSKWLMVLDRSTGKKIWSRQAEQMIVHNNVVAAEGKVFMIDSYTPKSRERLIRKGIKVNGTGVLYALDLETGDVIWQTDKDIFGTFLSYSDKHRAIIQGAARFRDRPDDQSRQGIVVYNASDGEVLWQDLKWSFDGQLMIYKDLVIMNGQGGYARNITDGQTHSILTPESGPFYDKSRWQWRRDYGCCTAIGSQNLLAFRSGCAGYVDMTTGGLGTHNLGGFKSGCTTNMIPADGIVAIPDYTRTCTCAYQNQASLAVIHIPEMMQYADINVSQIPEDKKRAVAVNFAAHGWVFEEDRMWRPFNGLGFGGCPNVFVPAAGILRHSFSREQEQKIHAEVKKNGRYMARREYSKKELAEWFGIEKLIFDIDIDKASVPVTDRNNQMPTTVTVVPAEQASGNTPVSFSVWLMNDDMTGKEILTVDIARDKGDSQGRITIKHNPAKGHLWLGGSDRSRVLVVPAAKSVNHLLMYGDDFATNKVACTGYEGMREIIVWGLGTDKPCTLRLIFAELDGNIKPDQRVFDVEVNGKIVIENLDIRKETGGPYRPLVKEIGPITCTYKLPRFPERENFGSIDTPGIRLRLIPKKGNTILCALEAVAQEQDGDARTISSAD